MIIKLSTCQVPFCISGSLENFVQIGSLKEEIKTYIFQQYNEQMDLFVINRDALLDKKKSLSELIYRELKGDIVYIFQTRN